MYSHRTAFTTLALLLSLAATVRAQAPPQTVPFDRANLDTTCMACDDFYEFASRQHLAHDGQTVKAHSAVKSQTDYATKSMWIVEGDTPYDGRYIADVEFVRE